MGTADPLGMLFLMLAALLACEGGAAIDSTALFNKWFKHHAVLAKFEVGELGARMGRGVIATEDVQRGDMVLSWPRSMSLRPADLADTKIGPHTTQITDQTQRLVLTLMCERRNPNSRFREWIDALPKSYVSLMMGTAQELRLLDDESLRRDVEAAAASLERDYASLHQRFRSQPDVFPAEDYNKEQYMWARFMIDSRCWSLKGERLCVPGADFFNYGVSEQDQSNPDSDLLGHFFSDTHKLGVEGEHRREVVEIYSDRDCRAGEQ